MPCMIIRITRVAASPILTFPKGKERHTTTSNTAGRNSRPLGRAWGGALGGFGEGHLLAAVFVPAKAGLFERPKAAFFTVAADGVMHRMTVGMVETTRRKTRFPTVGTTVHAKAKPPSATTAFCIYVITLASAIDNGENAKKKPPSNGGPIPTFPKGGH